MLPYFYRLRESGQRIDRLALRQRGGSLGGFVYEPWAHERYGKRVMFAKLLEPSTTRDLIPRLEHAHIVRVQRGLLVAGIEGVARASKSKGERYRQTWICTLQRIDSDDWPAPPRDPVARGFDRAGDDADATTSINHAPVFGGLIEPRTAPPLQPLTLPRISQLHRAKD